MRFVIHTQYYPPEMGAPQARLSHLARWLVGQGHRVYVLTAMPNYPGGRILSGYGGLFVREDLGGISILRTYIYPSKSKHPIPRLANYLSFLLSSLVVGAALLPRVDWILTETPPPFLGLSGFLLAKIKGARWVLNVSDLWVESIKNFGLLRGESIAYRYLQKMVGFLYRKAWLITGQSKEIVREIQKRIPSARVYHLSNGTDTDSFHPRKKSDEVRNRFLKRDEIGFVYAGLHGFFQGLDQILLAATRLRDEPIRFILFGEGTEKGELIHRAKGLGLANVDFYPPLDHQQIPAILASMDVALVPLKGPIHGSVPSKIYEAMASGIPVLLAANGEAGEIVRGAGAGVAVAPGDIEQLAEGIRELAFQSERRRELGKAGRRAAENFYDRFKIAQGFETVLLEGRTRDKPMNGPLSLHGGVREIQKGLTIHRTEGGVLWASRGMEVCRSQDGGKSWQGDGNVPIPGWRKVVDTLPYMRRMSRGGIFGIWPQSDGARICVAPRMILRAEAGSSEYRCVFHFPRGFRPLNLCQGKDGSIYCGEYFLNLTRSSPVRIFGSKNEGRDWEVVYTFPRGSICHVHRMAYDPYEDAILVCTGDRDPEAGIWKTTDEFRNLYPLVRGKQVYRTTALIVRRACILYGTDDPAGKNYIMALDKRNGTVKPIQEIPGPVLYACQVGEYVVFATMVEKKNHEITIWAGNENFFRLVMHFPARKRNQLWRELMGYGTVILPEGKGAWPDLFSTPIGTYDYPNRLIQINLQETGVGF